MQDTVTERRVTYWAVQGERWCNVDGIINERLVGEWEAAGWKIVTRINTTERPIFGALLEELND